MSKATSIFVFIAVFNYMFVSTEVIAQDIQSIDCYQCSSYFNNVYVGARRRDCEGSTLPQNYLRNRTTSSTARNWKHESLVCEYRLNVENPGPPDGMDYLFARDMAPEIKYTINKGPLKPEEKIRCRKYMSVQGHNSLEQMPVDETGSISCACFSNGCNNMSMDQLIKEFNKL